MTVIVYWPGVTEELVVTESTELKLGDPEVGLNDADMPLAGWLETVSPTVWGVPETRLTVTEYVVLAPGVTLC